MRKQIITILTALTAAASGSASANTVVSNLGEAGGASVSVGPFSSNTQGDPLAQAFSTPTTGPGWTLNSLTFTLDALGSGAGGLTVELYSDNAGIPGTSLATLSGTSPSVTGFANYTFTTTSTVTLATNTTYFAVLTAPSPTSTDKYRWRQTTTGQTGDPGWAIADSSYYYNSGSVWTQDTGTPNYIAVDASAVPEPSTVLLVLAAAGGAYFLKRRRC